MFMYIPIHPLHRVT